MFRGVHEVIFGGGEQTIVHVPSVRVASATYAIEDLMESTTSDEREIVAGTAAQVDDFESETTEGAGPESMDPRHITVTDVTGAEVGRYYVIESEAGEGEIFACTGVGVGYLVASAPLASQYEAGSFVRGIELRGAFPSAAASNESLYENDRPLRVLWTYAAGGRVVTVQEQVRLVRSRGEDVGISAVVQDIRESWPELVKDYAGDLERTVVYSAKRVISRLRKRGLDPGQVLLGDAGHDVILARVLLHFADQGIVPGDVTQQDFHEQRKAVYLSELDSLTLGKAARNQVEVSRKDVSATSHSRRFGSVTVRP